LGGQDLFLGAARGADGEEQVGVGAPTRGPNSPTAAVPVVGTVPCQRHGAPQQSAGFESASQNMALRQLFASTRSDEMERDGTGGGGRYPLSWPGRSQAVTAPDGPRWRSDASDRRAAGGHGRQTPSGMGSTRVRASRSWRRSSRSADPRYSPS